MARKKEETLEQGLGRSASKKGLEGKERQRYIGGAIRNMEKRGLIRVHPKTARLHAKGHKHTAPPPSPAAKPATKPARKPYEKPAITKIAPVKKAYERPAISKIEHLELVVKKNAALSSQKGYNVYSMYNKKTGAYHGGAFRSMANAKKQATFDMEAHNNRLKQARYSA